MKKHKKTEDSLTALFKEVYENKTNYLISLNNPFLKMLNYCEHEPSPYSLLSPQIKYCKKCKIILAENK